MLTQYMEDLSQHPAVVRMRELTNVNIVFTPVAFDMQNDLFQVMLAGDTLTDISPFTTFYNGSESEAVDEGFILDLAEYEEYAPNYFGIVHSSEDNERNMYTPEGYLAQFVQFYTDGRALREGLAIRQDWLDELNLEIPNTYDELHDVLTALKTEMGVAGLALQGGGIRYSLLSGGFGIPAFMEIEHNSGEWLTYPLFQIDGTVYASPMTEEYEQYITLMNQWYSEGLINSDSLTWNQNDTAEVTLSGILQGDVAIWKATVTMFARYASQSVDEDFNAVPMSDIVQEEGDVIPLGNAGEANGANIYTYNALCISQSCAYPEIAIQYLDYFYSEEGTEFGWWGVEGETYTLNADGTHSFTELITNDPDGRAVQTMLGLNAFNGITQTMPTSMEVQTATYTLDVERDANGVWSANKEATYDLPTLMAFTAEQQSAFTDYWADISTYITENQMAFITGDRPLSDFDAYRETLLSMGIEDAVAIVQECYDDYMA